MFFLFNRVDVLIVLVTCEWITCCAFLSFSFASFSCISLRFSLALVSDRISIGVSISSVSKSLLLTMGAGLADRERCGLSRSLAQCLACSYFKCARSVKSLESTTFTDSFLCPQSCTVEPSLLWTSGTPMRWHASRRKITWLHQDGILPVIQGIPALEATPFLTETI